MDKVKQYEQYILQFLEEQANEKVANLENVETQIIADSIRHHYQLLRIGWINGEFVYYCVFHFDIKDGKVWIQQNNTELLVADILMEKGVKKSDIVLGFISPYLRKESGFAAA